MEFSSITLEFDGLAIGDSPTYGNVIQMVGIMRKSMDDVAFDYDHKEVFEENIEYSPVIQNFGNGPECAVMVHLERVYIKKDYS